MDELPRPATLSSVAASYIGEAIIRGDFAPGKALPEIPLAQQLNTSRGTVRAALRELEALGLVEVEPHKGAFVADLSVKHVKEVSSLRAILEGAAARLALEDGQRRESLVAALSASIDEMREVTKAGDPFLSVQSDMRFHQVLSSFSDHELLLNHLAALQTQTQRFMLSVKQYEADMQNLVDSHLPIMEMVRTGDAQGLERAVVDHITSAGERLLKRM